jgi:hypothetical protein
MIKVHPHYRLYRSQRDSAIKRGIEFQFTFEEWNSWWGQDIVNRGRKAGQLVMARIGDQGPYHPDNVVKKACGDNVREAYRNYDKSNFHHSEETKKHLSNKLKGRIISDETKIKMSQASTGRLKSEETKKKIGLGNKGKIISQEQRDKLSAASKPHTKEHEEKRLAGIKAYWANRKSLKEMNNG